MFYFRSRASTDSSSMAITPSSSKDTSSTTNSIVQDTFPKSSVNQKEIYTMNDELSSVPFHRRLFNSQKSSHLNRANTNHNVAHIEKTNNAKPNLKTINNRPEIDNSLPIGHHHFSLQSLLEALPAASVDTTNISEDQTLKHQNISNRNSNCFLCSFMAIRDAKIQLSRDKNKYIKVYRLVSFRNIGFEIIVWIAPLKILVKEIHTEL